MSGDICIYLIIANVQKVIKWFPGVEMTFTLQVEICFIVPYSQIIKRNNQTILKKWSNIPDNNPADPSKVGVHR